METHRPSRAVAGAGRPAVRGPDHPGVGGVHRTGYPRRAAAGTGRLGERAVSMSVKEALSIIAQKHIAVVFHEPDNQSSAMVVLESDQPLGRLHTSTTTT